MRPLRVEATLAGYGGVVLSRPIHLDALLGAAIVLRDDIPRARSAAECVELPIPLAQERGIYLASASEYAVEEHSLGWTTKRFPVDMAQMMGDESIHKIQITAGINKSYRLPVDVCHLEHDRIVWWCIGDREEIEALLSLVHSVGVKRRSGYGEVVRWTVEGCEPWGEGFPVHRHGYPTRNLPIDWPGLSEDAPQAYAVVSAPYWDMAREALCAVPEWR